MPICGLTIGGHFKPMLAAYLQDWVKPSRNLIYRPGGWTAESNWPSGTTQPETLTFFEDGMANAAVSEPIRRQISGHPAHGHDAPAWCPYGTAGDYAGDQATEDALALTFDSPPANAATAILGFPELKLTISADQPQALLAARLCDVAPGGESLLVSWGLLNLSHRESHEHPEPLIPYARNDIELKLNAAGHRPAPGHRWRVALSPSYWPHAWPSPNPVALTVHAGQLTLPMRLPQALDQSIQFAPPETASRMATQTTRQPERIWESAYDAERDRWQIRDFHDDGAITLLPGGNGFDSVLADRFTIEAEDASSARAHSSREVILERGDWQVRVKTESEMWADAEIFYVVNKLWAWEADQQVAVRTWEFSVARDQV